MLENERLISLSAMAKSMALAATALVALAGQTTDAHAQGQCVDVFRPTTCANFSPGPNCNGQRGCFTAGSDCGGTPWACSSFRSTFECETQVGCDWRSCQRDSDCPGSRYCNSNYVCVEPECVSSNDCSGGRVCVGSGASAMCVECANNSHCPGSQVCRGSGRSATCVDCTSNSHCSGGDICFQNQCVECTNNSHCGGNQICQNRRCTSATAWVSMGWAGDDYSDNLMRITCNNGEVVTRRTFPSEEHATSDMNRNRLLSKLCVAGSTVRIECLGENAERISELYQDDRGAYGYRDPIPGVWYWTWDRVDERRPYSYSFTISPNDLRERRFGCKYDD